MKWSVGTLLPAVFLVGLLAGCRTVYTVPVGHRTPSDCGAVKLYGTDNVPFEYEELGTVALLYQHTPQSACLRDFIMEVQKLGADAVVNFMLEPDSDTGGFWAVGTAHNTVRVTGVAVKVKRP